MMKKMAAVLTAMLVAVGFNLSDVHGAELKGSRGSIEVVPGGDSSSALDECISRQRKLDALFLIDESLSLRKNDPLDQRVPALKSALRALNSLTRGDSDSAVDVQASVAGFGNRFNSHKTWSKLDDSTLDSFLAEIDLQADESRKGDLTTRYHEALKGSLAEFESKKSDGPRCRLMIWFSDGEHDDDNSRELTSTEQRQISKSICGSDGLADSLRNAQIFTQAIGLNAIPEKMGLMRLIAEKQGSFSQDDFNIDECGNLPALGVFGNAENSGEIVDVITVPGGPQELVEAQPCQQEIADCAEMRFRADDSVVSFKTHITIPQEGIKSATFQTGSGVKVDLLKSSFEVRPGSLVIERLTEQKVLIEAYRTEERSLEGEWLISFSGPRALEATGKVKFLGDAAIDILDAKGQPADKIDRYQTEPLTLKVGEQAGGTTVEKLRVNLRGLAGSVPLKVEGIDKGSFGVEAKTLQNAANSDALKSSSAAELEVLPIGFVSGLFGAGGASIPIEFKVSRQRLSLSNGSKYPQYLPDEQGTAIPSFKGRAKGTITLRFKGPDAGDGRVLLATEPNEEHDFQVEGDSFSCEVPKQSITECRVVMQPGKDGYGEVEFPLSAIFSSDVAEDSATEVIPVRVSMTREPNVGKGVRNAALLVFGLIFIQLAIRAGFAVLVSRFGRLQPTAKKALLKIRITREGEVLGDRGNQLTLSDADHSYALELTEPQRRANVSGFELATSPLQTFLHSTTSPVGYVNMDGAHVFGSSGIQRPKKNTDSKTVGVLDLSLRKQWAIAISRANILTLVSGASEVEGILFAVLDPLEQSPVDLQLNDLEYSISGSTFSADLVAVIAASSDDESSRENSNSEEPQRSGDFAPDDIFISGPDPFATEVLPTQTTTDESQRKSRRRRKDPKSDNPGEPSGVKSFDPFDPFA
jgi:hypothetical protein